MSLMSQSLSCNIKTGLVAVILSGDGKASVTGTEIGMASLAGSEPGMVFVTETGIGMGVKAYSGVETG